MTDVVSTRSEVDLEPMPQVRFAARSRVAPAQFQSSEARPPSTPTEALSPDQAELFRIGEHLKLRRQDFAIALGISHPRLSTYLYGRTVGVPQEIMERARQLLSEGQEAISRREQLLARPMSEVVDEWMGRLGVDQVEFARLMGLNPATVGRWLTNQAKLDATALVRYEGFVEELAKRLPPPRFPDAS